MKHLSALAIFCACSLSAQAGWLDNLMGKKEEPDKAPAASASSFDLGAMTSQFTDSVMSYGKSSGDALLKSLGTDLTEQVGSLAGLIGQDPQKAQSLASSLGAISSDISETNWTELLSGLSGLTEGKLGEAEMASLTKTMELATAFGLQTFLKDTPYYDDASKAVTSLKDGKYVDAIGPLNSLMKNAKLTGDQQAMVDSSVSFFKDLGLEKGGEMLKKGIGSFF